MTVKTDMWKNIIYEENSVTCVEIAVNKVKLFYFQGCVCWSRQMLQTAWPWMSSLHWSNGNKIWTSKLESLHCHALHLWWEVRMIFLLLKAILNPALTRHIRSALKFPSTHPPSALLFLHKRWATANLL